MTNYINFTNVPVISFRKEHKGNLILYSININKILDSKSKPTPGPGSYEPKVAKESSSSHNWK